MSATQLKNTDALKRFKAKQAQQDARAQGVMHVLYCLHSAALSCALLSAQQVAKQRSNGWEAIVTENVVV